VTRGYGTASTQNDGYERRWTHRDLVEGHCTSAEYVADLKADVDARLARPVYSKTHGLIGWLSNRPLSARAQRALTARFKGWRS